MKKKLLGLFLTLAGSLTPAVALATGEAGSLAESVSCDFCHLCPAPLGFCVLWWAVPILLLLIILVATVGAKRRCPACGAKVKKKFPVCRWCGYDFRSGEASPVELGSQQDMFADRGLKPFPVAPPKEESAPPAYGTFGAAVPPPAEEPVILAPGQKSCPSCGARLPGRAMFCAECGRKLE